MTNQIERLISNPYFSLPETEIPNPVASREEQILKSFSFGRENLDPEKAFLKALEEREQLFEESLEEKSKILADNARFLKEAGSWSGLGELATFFASAAFIQMGLATATPLMGGILITAGALGVSNLVLSQLGLWGTIAESSFESKEEAEKYAELMPIMIGGLSTILGTVLGGAALIEGAFTNGIIEKTTTLLSATALAGSAKTTYSLKANESLLTVLTHKIENNQRDKEALYRAMESISAHFAFMQKAAIDMLSKTMEINWIITSKQAI